MNIELRNKLQLTEVRHVMFTIYVFILFNSLTTKEFLQTCFVAIVTIDSKTGPKNRDIFLLKF